MDHRCHGYSSSANLGNLGHGVNPETNTIGIDHREDYGTNWEGLDVEVRSVCLDLRRGLLNGAAHKLRPLGLWSIADVVVSW